MIINNYFIALVILALLSLGISIYFLAFLMEPPLTSLDTSFYQHAGWLINQGYTPYVNIWDVKPPLHFELQALYGFFAGDSMHLLHWINVVFSGLALVVTVICTAVFVEDLTGSKIAALVAGLSLLAFPDLYIRASTGFRNKIYMLGFGSSSLLLQKRDEPFWSGLSSLLATGFWQFGVVFPVMCLLFSYRHGRSGYVRKTLLGILLGGLLVLLPIFYWNAMGELLGQALLIPLILDESQGILERIFFLLTSLRMSFVVLLSGLCGLIYYFLEENLGENYWLLVGLIIVLVQLNVDLDGRPDVFLLLYFVALGNGFLVSLIPKRYGLFVVYAVLILSTVKGTYSLNQAWTVGTNVYGNSSDTIVTYKSEDGTVSSSTWRTEDFWSRKRPTQCHYRLSRGEIRWLVMSDQRLTKRECEGFTTAWNYLWGSKKPSSNYSVHFERSSE